MISRRKLVALLVGALIAPLMTTAWAGVASPAQATTTFPINGGDVSWPQCPVGGPMPMPLTSSGFVIFGLTRGIGFTDNPCLADQVAWARDRKKYLGAYSFTGFPTVDERKAYGASGPYTPLTLGNQYRNAGFYAAQLTITEMAAADLDVPFVWLDIEPSTKRPWHKFLAYNRAYIAGQRRAYKEAGIKTGFYLSPSSYDLILNWDYEIPEWRTVGPRARSVALDTCKAETVQGGTTILVQWWSTVRDYDLICPKQRTWTKLKLYFSKP